MAELRFNQITKEWVIISTERAKRPEDFKARFIEKVHAQVVATCPFCPGNETKTPGEVFRVSEGEQWRIRVVPNKFAALQRDAERMRLNDGYKHVVSGFGIHDVIIETPPHRWRSDSTEGEIRKDVPGDRTSFFLRKPSPDICSECHINKFSIANTKHDMNKVAPDERNILNQTPSDSGLCGICHLVHGGQKGYLWAREITAQTGMIVQDLCVSCHSEEGMAKKKVIKDYSHPLNISPFEKGLTTTLPLFDKEGKISKDGVMTCETCHDPHRWDPVRIISGDHSDIEGNAQNSFLRLENVPSSILCENCHRSQSYVEKTDHDLIFSAPSAKNMINQTPAESGTCGACHLMHNSKNKEKLWARPYGQIPANESIMNILCTSCHSEGNSAGKKTVSVADHPGEKLLSNALRNNKEDIDYFPIYDKNGAVISVGNITCPSCHNAHMWNPLFQQKGTGKNLEGNATNSFLRNVSYNNICIDCHGLDALFRFKYYHEPSERKDRGLDTLLK